MKNTLIALFLTVAFAFSSYADTKVLSVVTNGTEVITITETTVNNRLTGLATGIRLPYEKTVTTNVSVSTIPTEGHNINVDEWVKERELQFKAQVKAQNELEERKKQQKREQKH